MCVYELVRDEKTCLLPSVAVDHDDVEEDDNDNLNNDILRSDQADTKG